MTIGQIIFELLKSLGVAAVVSWFAKSVIIHFLSRKIEAYKIELKRESDKEIEEIKSRLQMVALERQIVFSRLHEKRAEIVAETYTSFHEVYSKAMRLANEVFCADLRTPKEGAQHIFEECLEFLRFLSAKPHLQRTDNSWNRARSHLPQE